MFDYGGNGSSASIHLAFTPHLYVANDKWILAKEHETTKIKFVINNLKYVI